MAAMIERNPGDADILRANGTFLEINSSCRQLHLLADRSHSGDVKKFVTAAERRVAEICSAVRRWADETRQADRSRRVNPGMRPLAEGYGRASCRESGWRYV